MSGITVIVRPSCFQRRFTCFEMRSRIAGSVSSIALRLTSPDSDGWMSMFCFVSRARAWRSSLRGTSLTTTLYVACFCWARGAGSDGAVTGGRMSSGVAAVFGARMCASETGSFGLIELQPVTASAARMARIPVA